MRSAALAFLFQGVACGGSTSGIERTNNAFVGVKMKFSMRFPNSAQSLFFLLFVITTVAQQTTTFNHYIVISQVRTMVLGIVIGIVGWVVLKSVYSGKCPKRVFLGVSFFLGLLFYGVSGSVLFGGFSYFENSPILLLFMAISVIYMPVLLWLFLQFHEGKKMQNLTIKYISIYFVASLILMFAMGGVTFGFPPKVIFSSVQTVGETRAYSQGFTSFCGMAGVFFFIRAFSSGRWALVALALSASFYMLSIMGGARGDFIAGILSLAAYLMRKPTAKTLLASLSFSVLAAVFVFRSGLWEDILLFQRLLYVLEGNYGERDVLAAQAVSVLLDQPSCFFFGCGFNYFQTYFGYEFALYPHNMVLELFITYGIVIASILTLLALFGVISSYIGWGAENPIFYIVLVDLIISLKSGSLIGFTTLPILITFVVFGFWTLRSRLRFLSGKRIARS